MNRKAQELEVRNIMQGLEEFATFMSFQGECGSLRILGVESVEQPEMNTVILSQAKGQVLTLPSERSASNIKQKSISIKDKRVH